jgi:hypothetical protein
MSSGPQRRTSSPSAAARPSMSLVTVSYRGDLELAKELCSSVDAYLASDAEHVLVVPRRDLALFRPLATPQRRVIAVEEVLPRDYHRLPVPYEIGAGPFRRRIRELWFTPAGVVRGWIIQQIIKLSAPSYTRAETIVFADSDIVLVAPFPSRMVEEEGRTRFYRVPEATADSAMHARWHDAAARLLAMDQRGYTGADYIGNLITWRRSTVEELQDHVARSSGTRWDRAVLRQHAFSEYILYGVFADHVLGPEAALVPTAEDLVHAGWFYDLGSEAGVEAFVNGCAQGQVGVAIQSTEPFTLDERRALVNRIISRRPAAEA